MTAHPSSPAATAHPRSRGENDGGFNWRANFPGSSPLTRGKLGGAAAREMRSRLIPAHAGKTLGVIAPLFESQAHPRSRGENFAGDLCPVFERGSSPLTRGKR